jgi:hypothetical protein
MVFNATFNNISVMWCSMLLLKETGVPGKIHIPAANHPDVEYNETVLIGK